MMLVAAHPDDECFGFGGALSLAAANGVETYVVCLTDGQAAKNRGDAESAAALGKMRRAEFEASCRVLGVAHQEVLDYHDAQLEFVDFSEASGRLVEIMRRFQPQVVLTFGMDGGLNTHPDHMMVSALTTAAFHWSGQAKRYPDVGKIYQPQRLYHLSTNFFIPGRPAPKPIPWTLTLDVSTVREQKNEAFREHASQAPLMEQTKDMFKQYGAQEFYTLVATSTPQAAHQASDFFEGLAE
jgi:LmbE family N-acetylglucosaminyl deacetylase